MQSFLFFCRWDLVCGPRVPSEDRGNWGKESWRLSLYANESRDEHAVYFRR